MKIKYIPLFVKHFSILEKMTTEEKGDFVEQEMDYVVNGTEPRWKNEMQEILHSLVMAELTDISDWEQEKKDKKKKYDKDRYNDNKGKYEE